MQGQIKGYLRKMENIHKLKAADMFSLSQFRKLMYEEQHCFPSEPNIPKLTVYKNTRKNKFVQFKPFFILAGSLSWFNAVNLVVFAVSLCFAKERLFFIVL